MKGSLSLGQECLAWGAGNRKGEDDKVQKSQSKDWTAA